ncbi:hypothetical protein F5B19DRAFT_425555 [Rostrohypoxylon terebratum]|nr:hypothetical protein F5B19DRAFT_425555 [Rostrohypoxylon terebratum]
MSFVPIFSPERSIAGFTMWLIIVATAAKRPPGFRDDVPVGKLFDKTTGLEVDTSRPCSQGWRNVLLQHGLEEFARLIRAHSRTLVTDTTWRDGQQSLLATRVRTRDLETIVTCTSHAFSEAYSLESWGDIRCSDAISL